MRRIGGGGDVAVAGAGVLGLVIALRLSRSDWRVTLYDPEPRGPSASRIAAGMLAAASEAVLDGAGPYALLERGRDGWLDLLPELGRPPPTSGALHLMAHGEADARRAAFASISAHVEDLASSRLPPWLAADLNMTALFTPDDWRLDADATLNALMQAAMRAGVNIRRERLTRLDPRSRAPVVLAAGWAAQGLATLAPELGVLTPIHGQLLRFPGGPTQGPVVRAPQGYLIPDVGGCVFGASMDHGQTTPQADPEVAAAQRAAAVRLAPSLAGLEARSAAGVRASTPDGLPLVGASSVEGLWLAVGARRNGWLLAPVVAEVIAAGLEGRDPGPDAPLLEPLRFVVARPAAGP